MGKLKILLWQCNSTEAFHDLNTSSLIIISKYLSSGFYFTNREYFTDKQSKSAQLGAAQRDFLQVNEQEHHWPIPTALCLSEWYQGFAGEWRRIVVWRGCDGVSYKKFHKNPLHKNKEGSLYAIYKKKK